MTDSKQNTPCECLSIQTRDSTRHFKGCPLRKEKYEAPVIVQLRLEDKVVRDAIKWWMVDKEIDRLIIQHESFGGVDFQKELGAFIVKLVKG